MSDARCVELVELITEYLEGALPTDVRRAVDAHLEGCAGCRNAVAQWRTAISLVGRLTSADIEQVDTFTRERLLATFHRLRPR
jgi:anti-sigma factor RsiW